METLDTAKKTPKKLKWYNYFAVFFFFMVIGGAFILNKVDPGVPSSTASNYEILEEQKNPPNIKVKVLVKDFDPDRIKKLNDTLRRNYKIQYNGIQIDYYFQRDQKDIFYNYTYSVALERDDLRMFDFSTNLWRTSKQY